MTKRITGVRVTVPASTANLGPGFDSLGLALNLYARLEMRRADHTVIRLHGNNLVGIPQNKTNLVYQIAQKVFERAGVSIPELEIEMHSEIPLTRGLGSSASAIVAALTAANALIGSPFTEDELFQLASEIEKHPDNVGPALFGGFVAAYWDGKRAEAIRIQPDERLEVLVAIPQFHLSTEKARNVLPKQVPLADAVFNVGHSNLLVAALCTGRLDMIRHAMKDALHQPYRSALVPGMTDILRGAADHGALGVALSGAGPTMLALVDKEHGSKGKLESFFRDEFGIQGIGVDTMWLLPDPEGVRIEILTPESQSSTFAETIKGEVRA